MHHSLSLSYTMSIPCHVPPGVLGWGHLGRVAGMWRLWRGTREPKRWDKGSVYLACCTSRSLIHYHQSWVGRNGCSAGDSLFWEHSAAPSLVDVECNLGFEGPLERVEEIGQWPAGPIGAVGLYGPCLPLLSVFVSPLSIFLSASVSSWSFLPSRLRLLCLPA